MNNYIDRILKPLTTFMICLIILGCFYEVIEASTGRFIRYSFEAAEMFGLIKNNKTTNLYFWEQDYFRIVVHMSFLLMVTSAIIFFTAIKKFRRFDRSVVIIILLSIIITINTPFMLYNFIFLVYSPYLISLVLFLQSAFTIIFCILVIIKLVTYSKNYRNYTIELKAMFVNIKKVDTIGYFSYNDFNGIIKYSTVGKEYFEEINDEYVIYVNSYNIQEFEEDVIFKLGYWSYYIQKVKSRLKNKELDYHDNAVKNAYQLLEIVKEGKKGKNEKN